MNPTDDEDDAPQFPLVVRLTAFVWILFGVLGMLLAGIGLVLLLVLGRRGGGDPTPFLILLLFGGISYGLFLAGERILSGRSQETLWTGVGSVILALFPLGLVGLYLAEEFARPRPFVVWPEELVLIGFLGTVGSMLLLAGCFALFGRARYRAWREANPPDDAETEDHPASEATTRDPWDKS